MSTFRPGCRVTSFGYHHGPAPSADLVVDVRHSLRNPANNPALIHMTGLDSEVAAHVMATPGATGLVVRTAAWVNGLLTDLPAERWRRVDVAIGCAGGRHRSVALAEALADALRTTGTPTEVVHRDVDRPVVAT
ncbi:UPF0042 nucleotide-binding protein [Murinocardiopsis flavida]|uniref:UPF0042 nucleotide-binding protein n=1 Tax=Murinocardiopsis flavida TaxID=645275 RepID=A0A2P8CDG8_9ACTN|nr:RNase adapter RapZ [Murinocardiopsis flavida]PSK83038.1 UPF0042 nucleotide-binding protein [Murinocardiopsis flavida]